MPFTLLSQKNSLHRAVGESAFSGLCHSLVTQGQETAAPSTVTAGPAAWRKELLFSVETAYVEPSL